MPKKQPDFKPSAATIAVLELLTACPVGEVVTYAAMRKHIRYEIDDAKLRGAITSARKLMLRDHHAVFAAVPTVGYQRLRAGETVDNSLKRLRTMKSTARRAMTELATADDAELTPDMRGKKSVRMTVLGVIAGCFDVKATKKLTDNGPKTESPKGLLGRMRHQDPDYGYGPGGR